MSYREAFPDFDPATMPAIPETWKDVSFKQDICPCFETPSGLFVYVDFADPSDRELEDGSRFTVITAEDKVFVVDVELITDSWEEVIALVG
jgi:hypothetical protein